MSESIISVTDASTTRAYLLSRPYIAPALHGSINGASVIIVPAEGFRDHAGPVFPVGTEQIFKYLNENLPANTPIEIAVNDEEYAELALHGALLNLGILLVKKVIGKIVVDTLADYLKKRLGTAMKSSDAKIVLLIEDNGRTASLSYEGPADKFQEALGGAVLNLTAVPEIAKKPALPEKAADDED